MNSNFIFTDDIAGHSVGASCVTLPKSIHAKADLLASIAQALSFPDTFGANWDALFDCLCDLSWVRERRVVIAHEMIPELTTDDLEAYLGVLRDAVASWHDNPGSHELVVLFPSAASAVLAVLA